MKEKMLKKIVFSKDTVKIKEGIELFMPLNIYS